LDSITLQAKPAENTRLVISASNAVVLELAQRFGVRFGRQKASERFSAAFALLGSGADGFERSQG
jgi:hypothetical protein